MKRLFFFVFKLAVIVALIVWLANRPGTAHIVWHDYVIETSAAFLGFCILGAGLVFYLLFRLWHLIKNGPEMWRLRRKLHKMREGHRHFAEGLIAVAAGDASEAGRKAVGARKLLGHTPATKLLQAQAAQLAGDRSTAREIFLSLAAESDSAVLGYRGLIMEALRAGDPSEAEKLIEKLRRLRPETPWLNLIHFEIAARNRKWDNAQSALNLIISARLLEPAKAQRHQAAMRIAAVEEAARQGSHDKALQEAERASQLAPDWLPASLALAQEQIETGHKRAARRTVERAWEKTPHPQLAAIYRAATEGDPTEAYRQIEHLCRDSEEQAASRLALAEAALEADIWGEARRHLMALIGRNEATRNIYRLLARLERREGSKEQTALQWLAYAADAVPDPVWLCSSCGGAQNRWHALCPSCGAFNKIEWRAPGVSRNQASETGIQGPLLGELISL